MFATPSSQTFPERAVFLTCSTGDLCLGCGVCGAAVSNGQIVGVATSEMRLDAAHCHCCMCLYLYERRVSRSVHCGACAASTRGTVAHGLLYEQQASLLVAVRCVYTCLWLFCVEAGIAWAATAAYFACTTCCSLSSNSSLLLPAFCVVQAAVIAAIPRQTGCRLALSVLCRAVISFVPGLAEACANCGEPLVLCLHASVGLVKACMHMPVLAFVSSLLFVSRP